MQHGNFDKLAKLRSDLEVSAWWIQNRLNRMNAVCESIPLNDSQEASKPFRRRDGGGYRAAATGANTPVGINRPSRAETQAESALLICCRYSATEIILRAGLSQRMHFSA
jgi:hypothetical protein